MITMTDEPIEPQYTDNVSLEKWDVMMKLSRAENIHKMDEMAKAVGYQLLEALKLNPIEIKLFAIQQEKKQADYDEQPFSWERNTIRLAFQTELRGLEFFELKEM